MTNVRWWGGSRGTLVHFGDILSVGTLVLLSQKLFLIGERNSNFSSLWFSLAFFLIFFWWKSCFLNDFRWISMNFDDFHLQYYEISIRNKIFHRQNHKHKKIKMNFPFRYIFFDVKTHVPTDRMFVKCLRLDFWSPKFSTKPEIPENI